MLGLKDSKLLDNFLHKFDRYFRHVPYTERIKLIGELKSTIIEDYENSKSAMLELKDILKRYNNKKALANSILQKNGFPPPDKDHDWVKIFVIFLFTGTIICLILITFFLKSFFPLFNIDDKEGTISFFGGRITFDESELDIDPDLNVNIFINGEEVSFRDLEKIKQRGELRVKGEFGRSDVRDLSINLDRGKFCY